jgi:Phage portal protein
MAQIGSVLRHAWNVFSNQSVQPNLDPFREETFGSSSGRPDRTVLHIANERSIISSIYTRLSIDVASVDMRHVRLDNDNRYVADMDSGLNNCLTVEANLDQAARAFRQDIALTLFDEGVAALVAVDTSISPLESGGFDILTLRVGRITKWHKDKVSVSVYNEATGQRQVVTLPKNLVAIVENPLYSVMNERSSTLQRLLRKLSLLDVVDDKIASGKLDLIIQLPYVIKSETKRQQAQQRREDIEFQMKSSTYGIAYTDATEKITQLNRPAENNLLTQVEFLMELLYSQLGLTKEVLDGTADEKIMLNYWNRTIDPILTAVAEEMRRKFLTKTARTQKQSVLFFKDPFRLVPVGDIAEIADKFTRNEIMTSNEMRQVVGMRPHPDPKADQLLNSNMPQESPTGVTTEEDPGLADLKSSFDDIDSAIEKEFAGLLSSNGNGSNGTP